MKFSIIINVLNGEKYIAEAVNSVIVQDYDNWELIIFDNSSTDNTLERIPNQDDPRIKIFQSKSTLALGEARNLALQYTSGELISFLDCDDIYQINRLNKINSYLEKHRDVDIVYSNSTIIDINSVPKRLLYKKPMKTGFLTRELIGSYFLSLETVCFRKKIIGNLTFNSKFSFIEEADFFIRLSQNHKFGYINEPLASWREHDESWTFKATDKFYLEAIEFKNELIKNNPGFYKDYQKEINFFINNQDVFHNKTQFLAKRGKKFYWIKSLIRRRKWKDYIQVIAISLLPRFILEKLYT